MKTMKKSPALANIAFARDFIDLKELKILIEYYNQKYQDRGQIFHVVFNSNGDGSDLIESVKKISDTQKNAPTKLIITSMSEGTITHSEPFCLSENKLIALRDSNRFSEFFKNHSLNSKIPFIAPKIIEKKSYQGDAESCHFIAMAILKDLTKEELEKLSVAENGYVPSPKMFKYSQSLFYVEGFGDQNILQSNIKESKPQNLESYISKYKGIEEENKKSRIIDKYDNKFKNIIKFVNNFPDDKISMPEIITVLIKEEEKFKSLKKSEISINEYSALKTNKDNQKTY